MMKMKSHPPPVTRMQGFVYTAIFLACVALTSGLVMFAPDDPGITAFHLLVR